MKCRYCEADLTIEVYDLGHSPLSNALLEPDDLSAPEVYFPLRVMACSNCWLVQTSQTIDPSDVFGPNYPYFSATSSSWLAHSESYTKAITSALSLDSTSFVLEIASNDGYLLRNFVNRGIPCLGVEPTRDTANVARSYGVEVLEDFFGSRLADDIKDNYPPPDLVIANNVYAHVPDIRDFTMGLAKLLRADGVATFEFPHLLNLIQHNQFDTVYHEHFSYLSLTFVTRIMRDYGLRIYDVERLPTHGGSLRIYICRDDSSRRSTSSVDALMMEERQFNLDSATGYERCQFKAEEIRNNLLSYLVGAKAEGRKIVGYGAAAKGNTLLNFCGIRTNLLPEVFDASEAKQGKYLPGSHIPVKEPRRIVDSSPDAVLIFPWNISTEVVNFLNVTLAQKIPDYIIAIPDFRTLSTT